MHSLSRQSAPLPDCPHGAEAFHYIQYESLLFQFMPLALPLHTILFPSSPLPPHRSGQDTVRSPCILQVQHMCSLLFCWPSTELTLVYWCVSSSQRRKKNSKGIVLTGLPQCGITSKHEQSGDHHPLHMFNKTGPTADLITLVIVIQIGYKRQSSQPRVVVTYSCSWPPHTDCTQLTLPSSP